MISKTKKTVKNKSKSKPKRPNPRELYNRIYGDKTIEKMRGKDFAQHIQLVSQYPQPRDEYWSNDENPLASMDPEELLEYVSSFTDRWLYFHG